VLDEVGVALVPAETAAVAATAAAAVGAPPAATDGKVDGRGSGGRGEGGGWKAKRLAAPAGAADVGICFADDADAATDAAVVDGKAVDSRVAARRRRRCARGESQWRRRGGR